MIIVGIEDCPTCKIVKGLLINVKYVELQRNKISSGIDPIVYEIKKSLPKLNTSGKFPVILSDDLTKIIQTEDILSNLQKQKLENLISEQIKN